MPERPGILYVVATPIGNLEDFSDRARRVLADVDLVAAEDTRRTGRLLEHFSLRTEMTSLHEHNEQARTAELIERLRRGSDVALVSDAGTPLVSDPGYRLVSAARAAGVVVTPVPGACAAIAALSIAGLPTDRFRFEGFLPARRTARLKRLSELAREAVTLVFYEAPHRLEAALSDLAEAFGAERRAVVGRELTKLHESTYAGTLGQLAGQAAGDPSLCRGEVVVVVAGAAGATPASEQSLERLLRVLLDELPLRQAVQLAASISGERRNRVYAAAVKLTGRPV